MVRKHAVAMSLVILLGVCVPASAADQVVLRVVAIESDNVSGYLKELEKGKARKPGDRSRVAGALCGARRGLCRRLGRKAEHGRVREGRSPDVCGPRPRVGEVISGCANSTESDRRPQ
jgi:hypothetical protein